MATMKLKFDGVCADCKAQLKAGEEVRYYKTKTGGYLFYCLGKHKNPTAVNPKDEMPPPPKYTIVKPQQEPIEPQQEFRAMIVVSKRLDIAVEIMLKRFPFLTEDTINPDGVVLAEILHQLGSLPWLDKVI